MKYEKFPEEIYVAIDEPGEDEFLVIADSVEEHVPQEDSAYVATYKLVRVSIVEHKHTYKSKTVKNKLEP
jgi:hypothetical protein